MTLRTETLKLAERLLVIEVTRLEDLPCYTPSFPRLTAAESALADVRAELKAFRGALNPEVK